ncbi:GNAT family N-acetyltransferase [Micromonospora terminaliae]|uniref:GNAT family N-acetyltransferase n=1 Tax=Micromonospora terminaliae TaxID=1914461 RepID=A0AAJ2ZLA9_9ACTN|nr:GNAT family N-acetyltransferase [Micromonospora terminaliae]NES31178.1 GNAT family N-acetyltransferase [Micromonospora terminaliae]QGL49340.1 GNAT family N-acetyltransferase [Micromonospora terminaliae]
MADTGPIVVRAAAEEDWPGIWPIIAEVARAGETFAMDATPDEATARADWMTPPPGRVTVACDPDGTILGTANMYANRPAQGSHVASGSIMVDARARERGVGRALVRDLIAWATRSGYAGIQFNAVVDTNVAAVRLYESEGFTTLGTAPGAFVHPTEGPVGLRIMWRQIHGG